MRPLDVKTVYIMYQIAKNAKTILHVLNAIQVISLTKFRINVKNAILHVNSVQTAIAPMI